MDEVDELQLIKAAQGGDERAEDELLRRYISLAKIIAHSFNLPDALDADDLASGGMLGLVRAIRSYDPNGGAAFKTYACRCIRNTILDALRHAAPNEEEALDENSAFCDLDPEAQYIEKENMQRLTNSIANTLNENELEVLELYLDDVTSYDDISSKLGVTRKKVDNLLYGLRKKIRKLLDEND